jgi:hypothetical protein
MARRDARKRGTVGHPSLPADGRAAVLLLKPGEDPLGLTARPVDLARAAARFLGVPQLNPERVLTKPHVFRRRFLFLSRLLQPLGPISEISS